MTKLLLIDLDGTIRKTISRNTFISGENPYDQQIIPEAKEQLIKYKENNYRIIGITNQGGVAENYKNINNCTKEQRYTLEICSELSSIYFCPDSKDKYHNYESTCYKLEKDDSFKKFYHSDMKHVELYYSEIEKGFKFPEFRKPQAGMLLIEIFVLDFLNELDDILYVGDRKEDMLAAENANIPFLWAKDWRNLK